MTTSSKTLPLAPAILKVMLVIFLSGTLALAQEDAGSEREEDILIVLLDDSRDVVTFGRRSSVPITDGAEGKPSNTTPNDRLLAEDNSDDEDVGDPEGRRRPNRPWVLIANVPSEDDLADAYPYYDEEENQRGFSVARSLNLISQLFAESDFYDEDLEDLSIRLNNLYNSYAFFDDEDEFYDDYDHDGLLLTRDGSDEETIDTLGDLMGIPRDTRRALANSNVKVMVVVVQK